MTRHVDPSISAPLLHRVLAFTLGASVAFYYAIFGGGFDADPRGFAALVIWLAIALGLAIGIFPRTRLPQGWQIAAALLAGLAAWTTLSLAWGDSAEKTFIETTRVLHYAGIVALIWLSLDRHTLSAAAGGVFAGAALITILALASRLMPDAFPVPDVEHLGREANRLEYPFGYWNALGAWSAMTAAMAVAWAVHADSRITRLASAAVLPVAVTVIYLTYSRGALVALGVGIVVTILASRRRWSAALVAVSGLAGGAFVVLVIRENPAIAEGLGSAGAGAVAGALAVAAVLTGAISLLMRAWRVDRWRVGGQLANDTAIVAVAAVAVCAVAAVASGFAGDVWDRVGEPPQSGAPSPSVSDRDTEQRLLSLSSARTEMYEAAFDAYESSTPLGIGAGNFEFWWTRNPTFDGYIVDAHSLYIESLAELGPVGLLLLAGALGWLGWMAIMARRASRSSRRSGAAAGAIGALAVFAVHAGIDWFWEYAGIVALALGSAAIAACGRSGSQRAPTPPLGGRLVLAGVAIAMAVIQFLPWSSVRAIRSSEDAIAEGNTARAISEADRAAGLESWGARPHAQLARAHAAAGNLGPARREMREAIRREPLNWRHRAQLAGLHRAAGDLEAADSAYRQAERIYRLNPAPIEFTATEMEQLASR